MKAYSKEVQDFIKLHVKGSTTKDLVALVNSIYNTDFTESKMRAYKKNHSLKSGTHCGLPAGRETALYPAKIKQFIVENHARVGPKDMAQLLNGTFKTSYTAQQMKSYYANHKISSGLTGYFQKGHTPVNKGRKGYCAPGCEKSWFSKGHMPSNHKPVGSERIDKDGYSAVKTAKPNIWKLKHKLIWEAAHGEVPAGFVVTFLDGDKSNFSIKNLALISQAENAMMEKFSLRSKNPEFTKTGILIAKVTLAGSERRKKLKQERNNDSSS